MADRRVPARDAMSKPKPWELTNSQWALYYWLLAHSKWNSFAQEGHYFIYQNSFTKAQIMRDCGIKSQQTISTGFTKLKSVGAISEDAFHEKALQIKTTEVFAPIDVTVLKFLLNFNRYVDPAMSITMLAIVARWFKFNNEHPISFTKTELGKLLGKTKQHTDDAGVVLSLALLAQYGIITLEQQKYTNNLGRVCVRYTITNVNLKGGAVIDSVFNEEGEPDQQVIDELWEKIRGVRWENEEG